MELLDSHVPLGEPGREPRDVYFDVFDPNKVQLSTSTSGKKYKLKEGRPGIAVYGREYLNINDSISKFVLQVLRGGSYETVDGQECQLDKTIFALFDRGHSKRAKRKVLQWGCYKGLFGHSNRKIKRLDRTIGDDHYENVELQIDNLFDEEHVKKHGTYFREDRSIITFEQWIESYSSSLLCMLD